MSNGIRTRIAATAAISAIALLSLVGTVGYLSLVEFTRQSQIDLLNARLDEVEADLADGDDIRPSASIRVGSSVAVIERGEDIPSTPSESIQVVRTVDDPEVGALVGIISTRQIDAALSTIRIGLWISVLVTGLVVGGITWVMVDQALAPVRRLRAQAEAIEADPSADLLPLGPAEDELAELAATFNTMLTKLRTADDERRRFVSDASHELRSPLMVLAADADYALQRPDPDSEAQLADLAESVRAQTSRLAALVDDLLTLAALDEEWPDERTRRPLGDVLLAASAADVSLPVLSEEAEQLLVPDVSRALTNLVANARHHSRDRVAVEVDLTSTELSIAVNDDGPGVPAAEREHIFKRFYRLDAGRSRTDGGAGLGLAIAKADADRVGGSVSVGTSPLGGARFTLTAPLTQAHRFGRP